jgi:hypothetical protein
VGNRITAALICLNAVGFLGCLILIATVSYQVPDVAIWIIRAIHYSLQMFVFGALLPVIVWAIAASEINRSSSKVRLVEDWARYFLLFVSGALFFIAASRLPNSIISSSTTPVNYNPARGWILGLSIFGEMWTTWNAWARDVGITPAIRRAFQSLSEAFGVSSPRLFPPIAGDAVAAGLSLIARRYLRWRASVRP